MEDLIFYVLVVGAGLICVHAYFRVKHAQQIQRDVYQFLEIMRQRRVDELYGRESSSCDENEKK